jgi:hypothetical protein
MEAVSKTDACTGSKDLLVLRILLSASVCGSCRNAEFSTRGCVSVAGVRMARSSKPTKANTMRKTPTTRGCMQLRSHSNIRRLRLREPKRCIRKRWASGKTHLAVVNSRCAHGLQAAFSVQAKAMSPLARKIRSRLEPSISLILCHERTANRIRVYLDVPIGGHIKASSQTLAERLTCENKPPAAVWIRRTCGYS